MIFKIIFWVNNLTFFNLAILTHFLVYLCVKKGCTSLNWLGLKTVGLSSKLNLYNPSLGPMQLYALGPFLLP